MGFLEKHCYKVEKASKKALAYCLYLLGRRQYSKSQISEKLTKKQYSPSIIKEVSTKLQEWGYLDDTVYAENLTRNLARLKPQSRSSMVYTLKKKGIEKNIAVATVNKIFQDNTLDEEFLAANALSKKIKNYSKLPKEKGLLRAKNYLLRLGFSYETISKVLRKNWDNFTSF